MIIAKSNASYDGDWQYDDAQRNVLYNLLSNTIYSESKRRNFEYLIQGQLSQVEYESFQSRFRADRIDPITMKGVGSMADVKYRLRRLSEEL